MSKYELYEGCNYSLTIDGEETIDMDINDVRKHAKKLVDKADLSTLQSLLENVIRDNGEYKDLGYCDQCGSYNEVFTYIDDPESSEKVRF